MDLPSTISLNIGALQRGGLWFPKKTDPIYKQYLYLFYSSFAIIFFLALHATTLFINLFLIINDMEQIAGTLYVSAIKLLTLIKAIFHIRQKYLIRDLVEELNKEIFQPQNEEQCAILNSTLKLWKIIFYIFLSGVVMTIFLWGLYPYFSTSEERTLPFPAWYPFDYQKSPIYEYIFAYQMLCIIFIANLNFSMDMFASGIMAHISVQCQLLCDNLKNLDANTLGAANDEDIYSIKYQNLMKCINHHRSIVRYSQKLNVLISHSVLAQYGIGIIVLCMTMFQLSLLPAFGTEFFAIFCYVGCVLMEIFLYCFYGTELSVNSSKIPTAIFESSWVGCPKSMLQEVRFFLHRSQTPVTLYAVNFFPLSIQSFTTILRTSWSYYAVLRQVHY